MNLSRVPEPPTLTPQEEADEYFAMDHNEVNRQFVVDLMKGPVGPRVIDLGCGPGAIGIELCNQADDVEVMLIDGEVEMLEIAKREIDIAGMLDRISLHHADVAAMDDFDEAIADTVISNSLIHHLDEPATGLNSALRLVRPGGRLFLRDLYRPASVEEVEQLVAQYTGDENELGQQLFRQSLHASLTLAEVQELAGGLGILPEHVQMSSDRHWTIDWIRPE